MSFIYVITHHPYLVLISVAVFSGTCLVIPFTLRKFPNFSDPRLGFETRGTLLARRLTAWHNLLEATKSSGPFIVNPKNFRTFSSPTTKMFKKKTNKTKIKKNQMREKVNSDQFVIITKQTNNSNYITEANNWKTLKELRTLDEDVDSDADKSSGLDHFHQHRHVSEDGFFCGTPDERYSRVVVLSTVDNGNLFNYKSLMAMCRIQYQLTQLKQYRQLCDTITRRQCCHPWSLVNYVALLHNRTSCLAITEPDINSTLKLLQTCSQYYHNLHLTYDCHESENCQTPPECAKYNAVFNILHYLTDVAFMPPNKTSSTFLKESVIFLPIACSTKTLDYYHALMRKSLDYENVRVVAMEFGLKYALFDEYLLKDTWLIGLGSLVILCCIFFYTESLFLTLMTITAIVFSLAISYFIYLFVYQQSFFPFMNLLAIVVAIGIGADDVFILCKVWDSQHKLEMSKNVERRNTKKAIVEIVTATFQHAVLSMFVTSATTAAAFYTSFVSSITVVRCFSVFAGTAVIANFCLMITWLPASLVILKYSCLCPYTNLLQLHNWFNKFNKLQLGEFSRRTVECVTTFLEKWIVIFALKLRYIWLVVFTIVTIISGFVVLHYPGIQLPDYLEFQLFESSHPFEQYDLIYKQKFFFERLQIDASLANTYYKLPLRFVWGIREIDNGNYMDPASKGSLEIDETFDMADPRSQEWLELFCRRLRQQPFYMPTLGPLLPNCFIESFMSWMQRSCIDAIDHIDRSPCCETAHFPYDRNVFDTCIVQAMSDLYETPSQFLMPGVAGPKFSKLRFPAIQALVVEYDSNYTYSMSYPYMDKFFKQVEQWMREQMKTAPSGMRNGWFISDLEFYDLQRVLSESTVLSIGLAMTISFIVLLLVTLNILISVFAIITISCSIFATVALLVLFHWKLNVLESIAVSTAIGLAVDFSLHYAISYKLFNLMTNNDRGSVVERHRRLATRFALNNMCGPTAMAALTTGIAGALMLPSAVLPYIQIGVFLVVVMTVSWLYSTFFFNALLSIIGPEHGYGQFRYPVLRFNLCYRKPRHSATSISDVPNSKTRALSQSESHELEPLALTNTKRTGQHKTNNQSPSAKSDITLIITDDT